MTRRTLAALAVAALIALGCGNSPSTPDPVDAGPTADAATGTKAAKKPAGIGDGQHAVGDDIKPGTYTTTVGDDSFGCYWARVKNFDGELDSIISNGNLAAGAKGRVVVKKTDGGIEFNGGCTWVKK